MKQNIFIVEAQPSNWKDAIKVTSDVLYENGFVTESFFDMCVQREIEFPTGLRTLLPVAIPHTNDSAVIKTAICLLRLVEPVKFRNMENSDQDVEVDFVLNLAINDGGAQLNALQNTIKIFQDPEFKKQAKDLSLNELKQLFVTNWNHDSELNK